MYVELVIIGLETLVWITLIGTSLTETTIQESLIKLPADSALVIGIGLLVCYVLGIIADRIFSRIFYIIKLEDKIKEKREKQEKYELKAQKTLFIWHEFDEIEYYNFTMSRKRILRATAPSSLLILIAFTIYICKFYLLKGHCEHLPLFIYIFLLIFGTAVSSLMTHNRLISEYYEKAITFEKKALSNQPAKKNQ